jgi:hypothetical protein
VRIQGQQLAHQRKRDARLQRFVLAHALELGVSGETLLLEQAVAVLQIEQGARGNRDHEAVVGRQGEVGHGEGGVRGSMARRSIAHA